MKLSLWAYHFHIADRSVVPLSFAASLLVLHPLSLPCSAPAPPRCMMSASNPLLVKLQKSRLTAHPHSGIPPPLPQPVEPTSSVSSDCTPHLIRSSFVSTTCGTNFPQSLQSHSSLQCFKTAIHPHDLFYPHEPSPNPPLSWFPPAPSPSC